MGFSKDLSAYTEVINQVQTKSGISLTINEVILDNYSLIVSVKPDYEEKKKESLYLWINDEKTLINGKRYQSFSSTTGLMDLDSYTKYEMDTEMVLMQEYDGVELPAGETEIHLVLDVGSSAPISEKNRSENITEFVYDFTITAEQLKEQTIRKKMNMEISGGDGCNLILKELAMNDLHSRITALGVTPDHLFYLLNLLFRFLLFIQSVQVDVIHDLNFIFQFNLVLYRYKFRSVFLRTIVHVINGNRFFF